MCVPMPRTIDSPGIVISFEEVIDLGPRRLAIGDRLKVWAIDEHDAINFYHPGTIGRMGLAGTTSKANHPEISAAIAARQLLVATVIGTDGGRSTVSVVVDTGTHRKA